MPTIKEYRVVMPLSLEEFNKGRRWHKTEQTKLAIRLLQDNEVYVSDFGERILFRETTSYIPSFHSETSIKEVQVVEHVKKGYGGNSLCTAPVPFPFLAGIGSFIDIMVSDSIKLTEVESWEAFPHLRSVSDNCSLGVSKYQMIIESVCIPGNGIKEENPLNLTESILKKRKVVLVDIAGDVAVEDYRDGKDPILFRSTKTARGPLEPGVWMDETQPCLTCFILISVKFDFLGPVGRIAERQLHKGLQRALTLHHRELFCYIDEWIDSPLDELIKLGEELQQELEDIIKIKTTPTDDNTERNRIPSEEDGSEAVEQASDDIATAIPAGDRSCPIEMVKTKLFCSRYAGGSQGYAYSVLGCLALILALFIALGIQNIF